MECQQKMWVKKGLIYSALHAQLPTVEVCSDRLRIYFSSKVDKTSYINYIEVNSNDPSQIIYVNPTPVLTSGVRGCFDDSGVMPSCIVSKGWLRYLYYTGWNIDKGGVPYGHGIGVAVCGEYRPKTFIRKHLGPLLDRRSDEPFLCNSACVVEDGYYYCSGTGWDGNFPHYCIAYRNDNDYMICLDNENKYAMSRPCVIKDQMWFGCRSKEDTYSIKYAEKKTSWEIVDGPVVEKSATGWDSEMVSYPWVVDVHGRRYMFYNGNGYGATGIGYAEWK